MLTALPATAVGAVVIVSVFVSVAFAQGLFAFAVSVNITLPAVMSAELGVYVTEVNELALTKLPVPLDVQATLV